MLCDWQIPPTHPGYRPPSGLEVLLLLALVGWFRSVWNQGSGIHTNLHTQCYTQRICDLEHFQIKTLCFVLVLFILLI